MTAVICRCVCGVIHPETKQACRIYEVETRRHLLRSDTSQPPPVCGPCAAEIDRMRVGKR